MIVTAFFFIYTGIIMIITATETFARY